MHGNEQIINELIGKYVHRLNKSTRQQFLVNLAARRCDDDDDVDSNSEGSSVVDEVGGMDNIELSSSEEQVTAAPRPPRYAVLAPSASSPEYFKSSSGNQRRALLSGEQLSKTVLASVPMTKQAPAFATISRVHSSPILRRAEALTRKTTERENLEARYDTNKHRLVLHPNRPTLDHKLSKSISQRSSSFTEVDDDISIAASAMSTESIQSALYLTSTISEDYQPNLVVYAPSKSNHQPRLPMRGSYVHATYNKSLRSKKFDTDDTSTVTTEAISMFSGISLSRSTSFESAASYEVLQVDKSKGKESIRSYDASLSKNSRRSELNRLKKLTLICPTNSEGKSWNPEKKIENSQTESMGRESIVADNKAMQVIPARTSLKDLKSKRYSLGRVNAPEGNETMKAAFGHPGSTAVVESETVSTRSKLEDGNRPMTAIAKRALLRRHSTSRAQSATQTNTFATSEDSSKYTHAPTDKMKKVRSHSMSPLQLTSSRVGSPMVDDRDIKNRSSNCGIARTPEEQKKEAAPPMPRSLVSIETNCSSAISSRAERRRSRSVSRSRTVPPSSPCKRLSPSLNTTAINSNSHMGTPPRCAKRFVNKTSTSTMTPTPSDDITSPSISSSPMRTSLMRSALNKRFC